jgi:hypothetical protein
MQLTPHFQNSSRLKLRLALPSRILHFIITSWQTKMQLYFALTWRRNCPINLPEFHTQSCASFVTPGSVQRIFGHAVCRQCSSVRYLMPRAIDARACLPGRRSEPCVPLVLDLKFIIGNRVKVLKRSPAEVVAWGNNFNRLVHHLQGVIYVRVQETFCRPISVKGFSGRRSPFRAKFSSCVASKEQPMVNLIQECTFN